MKRYGVSRCDEGGTLTDSEGNQIDHTWDVIDRFKGDGYGHPSVVINCNTRKQAREFAQQLNFEDVLEQVAKEIS